ncbi:MAG TPA: VWA domain-containing protein [Chloroflexota bacterium]|nr:VWA domain-containing protein [Chloroflexota bacterium]
MPSPATRQPDFLGLAGLELARQAALLLLVEPRLRGLLLLGGAGAGKSALISATAQLWQGLTAATAHGAHEPPRAIHHLDQLTPAGEAACWEHRLVLAGGETQPNTWDRFGLVVQLPASASRPQRLEVLERALAGATDPLDMAALIEDLRAARELLPRVQCQPGDVRALAEVSCALGVEGNRADWFALLAAQASAALERRIRPSVEDLELAVQLVLACRARTWPDSAPQAPEAHTDAAPGAADTPDTPRRNSPTQARATDGLADQGLAAAEADARVGDKPKPGQEQGGSVTKESRPAGQSGDGNPQGPPGEASADMEQVLLAAVARAWPPAWDIPGRASAIESARGASLPPRRRARVRQRIALAATVAAALPWQRARGWTPGGRPRLRERDLRWQRRSEPPSTLHLVVFDASASMASNRLAEAKGAVIALLRRAYQTRDMVALVAFRRDGASLLLAPTRALALGRRAIEALPAGGGTPLAAGLDLALRVLASARRQRPNQSVRVAIVTDGRVASTEWSNYRRAFAASNATVLVLDTRPPFGDRPASLLAAELGATYASLLPSRLTGAVQFG